MASEAAVVERTNSQTLASLTPAEMKEWRVTGKLPSEKSVSEKPAEKESKTEAAASSPAAKTEVTEIAGEKPASETSAAPVTAKEEPKPKGAEARIKALLAENKKLESEILELRKKPAVAQAKPIEEPARPRRNDVDSKTGLALYASDDAYSEALEKYLTAKVTADVEKRSAKAQAEQRIVEQRKLQEKKWHNALKIANEKHPDFAQVCEIDDKGAFQNKALKSIKSNGVLDAWILDSDMGAEILYHLAKTPEDIERIESLPPFSAARELTKLEDKLSGSVSAPPKEEKAEVQPKPKVTGAPAPAASIAGKATAPADEIAAAVDAEDFRRYARVANAADHAKRKAS